MSVLLMTKAWKINVENAARKLVLIKLADNANEQGICWPSYKNLAINCEMSRRTVMRHVEDLILTGFIKKQSRKGGVHINKSNLFQLTIDEGDISTLKEAKKAQKLAKKKDVKTVASDNLTLGIAVTEDHQSGDTGSPDLVIVTTLPSDTGSPRTINRTINRTVMSETL
jgi:DNA-binding transcriptional regulator YhcF (GntR family)